MTSLSRRRAVPHRLRRVPLVGVALLTGTLALSACSGDEVDPTDADTGLQLESVAPDPAASPAESEDPLTGSEP